MPLSEQQLIAWSSPVGTSEDQKCKNAISQVTDALRKKFGDSLSIFLQGSYRNNTNVKQDSDVDIVVRHNGYYFPNLIRLNDEQKRIYHANHPNSNYTFAEFKNEVQLPLKEAFGNVERKNKCILIPGNTYRVNADAVPCFKMKRFANENQVEVEGIQFYADDGKEYDSYPEQHYVNGVSKRAATGQMYKKMVRILKRLRNELIDANNITDKFAPSFLIECLVYNVPNDHFIAGNYRQTLRNVISKIYNDMDNTAVGNEYLEVSELKWLFKSSSRSMSDAKEFMLKCWQYAGFT